MFLREYLESNRIYFHEFAKLVGVTPTYISEIVRGTRRPSLKLLLKIVEATKGKVTIQDLINTPHVKVKEQRQHQQVVNE